MTAPTPPADAVVLDDPGSLAGTYSAALVADVKEALDVWTSHLSGLGTLTVSVNLVNDGQNGLLANGGSTQDMILGAPTPDGHTLAEPGAIYELKTGHHLGGAPDITINVNEAYLSQLYLGGGTGVPSGEYDGLSLFEHEITHGLGFGGFTSTSGSISGSYETLWDRDLASIGGNEVFTGANATAANGGSDVNVTTLDNGEGYAHLANTNGDPNARDLMTGLGLPTGVSRGISSVDLAILADVGAPVTGMAGTVTLAGTTTLSALSGTTVSLGGVTLADTGMFTGIDGASLVTLTASDTLGTLGATNAGASLGATMTSSSGGHALTLTGSLAAVQADLATMTYVTSTYVTSLAGPDTITLSVVDSYGNAGSGSVAVTIAPGASYAAPVLSGIAVSASASGSDGWNTVRAGAVLTYTLTTTGPVTLAPGATLGLALGDRGTATYDAAASTSTSLVFTSTVLHGQFGVASVTGIVQSPGALTSATGGPVTLSTSGVSQPTTPGSGTPFVDATGPLPPEFGLAVNDSPGASVRNISSTATPALRGVAFTGDTVIVSDSFGGTTSVLGTATADGTTGVWTLPVTTPLADGVHTLTGVATDPVEGVSNVSIPVLVTIDTVAPPAPTLALAAAVGGVTDIAAAVLTGTAEAGDHLAIFDNGVAVAESLASASGSWTATLDRPPLVMGANALTASAMDEAGNVSPLSAALDVTLAAPPSATGTVVVPTIDTAPPLPGPASAPAAPALPFTLDGVQAGTPAYAADAGSHYAVVNAGTASIVANASATSTMTVYGNGGSVDFTNGGGSGLVVGTGLSSLAMTGGTTGSTLLAFTSTGATTYTGGSGTDEVISGGGAMTLTGGTGGSLLVFGGAGTLDLVGNGESDVIVGGAGAETIHAGLGAVFGGSGGSLMSANGAGTFLAGDADGDQMSASSLGGDILAGGAGRETLSGAGSANGNIIFAGTGSDLVSLGLGTDTFAGGTGGDTIQAGAGNATLYLGTGAASLVSFTSGSTGGTDTLSGFRVGTDHLSLHGYAAPARVSTTGGNTTLGLADGTRIILQGVTSGTTTALLG